MVAGCRGGTRGERELTKEYVGPENRRRIGELARLGGVSTDTVRYYERTGLLLEPERTESGYRLYAQAALDDLRFIKRAQAVGLRLDDIREILEIARRGRAPCEQVRSMLVERLAELERQQRELRSLSVVLRRTIAELKAEQAPYAGCRCAVIEASGEAVGGIGASTGKRFGQA